MKNPCNDCLQPSYSYCSIWMIFTASWKPWISSWRRLIASITSWRHFRYFVHPHFLFPLSCFLFPFSFTPPPPSSLLYPSLPLASIGTAGFFFCFSHLFPINRLSTDHPTLQLILIELWLNWRLLPIYQPEWVLDLRPTIAWSKLVKSASGHTI